MVDDLERGVQSRCTRWCIAARERMCSVRMVCRRSPKRYRRWCSALVFCLAVTLGRGGWSWSVPRALMSASAKANVTNASDVASPTRFQQVDFTNAAHTQRVRDALLALRIRMSRDGWHCLSALNVDVDLDLIQVRSLVLINPSITHRSTTNTSLWEVSPFAPEAASFETSRAATVTVEYASMSGRRQSQTFGAERWCPWSWCPVDPSTLDSHCVQHLLAAHAAEARRRG